MYLSRRGFIITSHHVLLFLPHNTDSMSDHLPLKVTFNISCDKVRVTNDRCNGRVASIPRIDRSKETNRIKYLNCLNKKSEYIDEVNIDLCGNAETAQILVNKMNQQIVNCIQDSSICAAGKTSNKPKTIKRNPWWTKSTNVAKNRKSMS